LILPQSLLLATINGGVWKATKQVWRTDISGFVLNKERSLSYIIYEKKGKQPLNLNPEKPGST
jgi:hypothetical protein